MFRIILILFSLFIFNVSNSHAEEEWSVKAYDGYSYAAVSGEIQYGDKLIFILDPSDNCERVTNTFSFYTWEDPRDLKQLIDKDIPLKLNGKVGLTARVIAVNPILNGNHIILSLGAFPIKDYVGFLDEFYKKIKKSNHLNRLVTLSPLTEMAKKFHLRNKAKLFRVNETTQNFEYF